MQESLPERLKRRLRPNGCTMFLEGTHTKCCDLHDSDYAIGIARLQADRNLKACMEEVRYKQYIEDIVKTDNLILKCLFYSKYCIWRILTVFMYIFVRSFGWYFWQKARWYRLSKPSGDNWWVKGRIKLLLLSKYKRK